MGGGGSPSSSSVSSGSSSSTVNTLPFDSSLSLSLVYPLSPAGAGSLAGSCHFSVVERGDINEYIWVLLLLVMYIRVNQIGVGSLVPVP